MYTTPCVLTCNILEIMNHEIKIILVTYINILYFQQQNSQNAKKLQLIANIVQKTRIQNINSISHWIAGKPSHERPHYSVSSHTQVEYSCLLYRFTDFMFSQTMRRQVRLSQLLTQVGSCYQQLLTTSFRHHNFELPFDWQVPQVTTAK